MNIEIGTVSAARVDNRIEIRQRMPGRENEDVVINIPRAFATQIVEQLNALLLSAESSER